MGCGKYSYNAAAINQSCGERFGGKRCKGAYRSAIAPGDWIKCEACGGSGRAGDQRCDACQATGWNFVRPRF
jgi:primosomal protein N'